MMVVNPPAMTCVLVGVIVIISSPTSKNISGHSGGWLTAPLPQVNINHSRCSFMAESVNILYDMNYSVRMVHTCPPFDHGHRGTYTHREGDTYNY